MKKFFILAAGVAVALSSCNGGGGSLKSEQDSVAYAVGLQCGDFIKSVDSTMNLNVVMGAVKDVINNKQKMDNEAAMAFMREYFMVRKPARAKVASEEFLAKVEKENPNVKKTESGLLYEIIKNGSDLKAVSDSDEVKVIYEGRLKEGKVFDSSKERGDTVQFALNRVIKGWSEGMKLVGKGGTIKLWIPAELAYGAQGAGNVIGPNEALVFEVELVDVIPADSAKAE